MAQRICVEHELQVMVSMILGLPKHELTLLGTRTILLVVSYGSGVAQPFTS